MSTMKNDEMQEGDPPTTDLDIEILAVLIQVFCGGEQPE